MKKKRGQKQKNKAKSARPAVPDAPRYKPTPADIARGLYPNVRRANSPTPALIKKGKKKKAKKVKKTKIQTPAERRLYEAARRGLTPEQYDYQRYKQGIKRYKKKKRRISAVTVFFTRFITFMIIYVCLFALCSGLFTLTFLNLKWGGGADITYQLGDYRGASDYKVGTFRYKDYVRDGRQYVNFTELAGYFDFITTGELGELRFLTKYRGGEEIKFFIGTRTVSVNGNMLQMPSPSYYESGELRVPLELIETYVQGIYTGYGATTGRLVIYREYTLNTKNEKLFFDVTFTLKPQEPLANLDWATLPDDIKILTEPGNRVGG